MSNTDFQKLTDNYNTEVSALTNSLKQAFSEKYVNNKANLWIMLDEAKMFLNHFFSKPE